MSHSWERIRDDKSQSSRADIPFVISTSVNPTNQTDSWLFMVIQFLVQSVIDPVSVSSVWLGHKINQTNFVIHCHITCGVHPLSTLIWTRADAYKLLWQPWVTSWNVGDFGIVMSVVKTTLCTTALLRFSLIGLCFAGLLRFHHFHVFSL